jgi:hypothetical protein
MPKRRNSGSPRCRRSGAARLRAALGALPVAGLALLLAACLPLLLAACLPPQAHYEMGLGTSRISGFLTAAPEKPTPGGALIVVYLYHHQFITYADGSAVLMQTARVLRPGTQGDFAIDVPGDVVRMDILFIAPEHLTELFRFRRQLGVGDIDYRAALQAMRDWRSHYYTYLSPQLENLILEPRYHLPPADQQVLADWMQAQDARLGARPGHS